jgi:hypothetical protein
MNLSSSPIYIKDYIDRRVAAALRFVDAVTGLPVRAYLRIETRGALVVRPGGTDSVSLNPDDVRFVVNRSGLHVITRAPFFDEYTSEFDSPVVPAALQGGIIRLRLALVETDTDYLPQEFDVDLPRSLSAGSRNALHVTSDVSSLVLSNAPFAVPVTGGTFTINGAGIAVQPSNTLQEVFTSIFSATNVSGSYNASTDQIVLSSAAAINIGSTTDTSNFLIISKLMANGTPVIRSHGRVTGSVFVPQDIPVFRSPSARSGSGWVTLRARVVKSGTDEPLPGVLIRVFRSPRGSTDLPVGTGFSDWRGEMKGEAVVPVIGITRFRTGGGDQVVETEQPIEFETTRIASFSGSANRIPCLTPLLFNSSSEQVIAPSEPAIPSPAGVMNVRAGREYTVTLSMP